MDPTHSFSSEFFYVISGKIKISTCNSPHEFCNPKTHICSLRTGDGLNGDITSYTLISGGYEFIPSNMYHTFEALEDSGIILIAFPPISRLEVIE